MSLSIKMMMLRNYVAVSLLCLISVGYAKSPVDCAIIMGTANKCNQYGSKLIRAKEINYEKDTKKLIISKTLPVPKKAKVKVISVPEMIENYVKVEDPLRFKSTYKEPESGKGIKKTITNTVTKEKIKSTHTLESILPKKTHTLESILVKKTHMLSRDVGTYTITSGDSLGHIVSLFGVSKKSLLTLNGIDSKTTLKIGQKLKIPLSQKMIDIISSAKYKVESGDTLLSIAKKFRIDPKNLGKFNHLKSNANIKIGQIISLPFPHIVKKIEAKKKLARIKAEKARAKQKKRASYAKIKMLRNFGRRNLRVTATAYTSHKNQTDSTPFIAAWGNRIRPGMKMVAVSRDLLTKYGMKYNTRIRIGGLPGYYFVRDKMNKRYKKRIDIYMGLNKRRAFKWGRRSVRIYY